MYCLWKAVERKASAGNPSEDAHGGEGSCVWGVREAIRVGGVSEGAREDAHGGEAVWVWGVREEVRPEDGVDGAREEPYGTEAVQVRVREGVRYEDAFDETLQDT